MFESSLFILKNQERGNSVSSLNNSKDFSSKKIFRSLVNSAFLKVVLVCFLITLPTAGYSIDAIWNESTSTNQGIFNTTTSTEVFASQTRASISNGNSAFKPGSSFQATGVVPLEDAFLALFFSIATYGAYVYRRRKEHR
ncbi:MAG: hypothetical protein Q4F97_02865 [Bacteroidales bacterium]|nr:hypothetical protein [Bacteroidales bacterium]